MERRRRGGMLSTEALREGVCWKRRWGREANEAWKESGVKRFAESCPRSQPMSQSCLSKIKMVMPNPTKLLSTGQKCVCLSVLPVRILSGILSVSCLSSQCHAIVRWEVGQGLAEQCVVGKGEQEKVGKGWGGWGGGCAWWWWGRKGVVVGAW